METPSRRRAGASAYALLTAAILAVPTMASAKPSAIVAPAEMTKLFSSKHPGATWIIEHDDVFKLKPQQRWALEGVRDRFAGDRQRAEGERQAAFAAFKAQAGKTHPDASTLDAALQALSQAELSAATATVDAHAEAFAVLDPAQQAQFDELVKCCAPPP